MVSVAAGLAQRPAAVVLQMPRLLYSSVRADPTRRCSASAACEDRRHGGGYGYGIMGAPPRLEDLAVRLLPDFACIVHSAIRTLRCLRRTFQHNGRPYCGLVRIWPEPQELSRFEPVRQLAAAPDMPRLTVAASAQSLNCFRILASRPVDGICRLANFRCLRCLMHCVESVAASGKLLVIEGTTSGAD